MAFPSQEKIDIIATQILLYSQQALTSLKAWNNTVTDAQAKVRLLKELIKATAKQMNGDMRGATSAVAKFSNALNVNPAIIRKIGNEGESSFKRVFNSINTARIALGALTSMLLFQVIQAINQVTRDSVKQFTELEDSLWRIVVAEKALSQQGIEVSVEGLKKGIQEIKNLLPIFSEQDISGLVGKVAISTKELGYSEQQILDLAKAIAILNVVSTENEDLTQTAGKVITALLSGTTKGVSGLGVTLNDTVIKAKAVEMEFIKSTDSLEDLTKQEKDLVKLNIVLGTAADSLGLVDEYLKTNAAKLKENSSGWDDLKTAIGGFTSAIIPALSEVFEFLADSVNMFKVFVVLFDATKFSIVNIVAALSGGANAIDAIRKGIMAFKDIPRIFSETAEKEIPQLFATMPKDAPDWFKNIFGKYLKDVETATDKTAKWKDELEDEDALKALEDIEEKIQDIILDAKQAREDLNIKLEQKRTDLDTEYDRKRADAAREHAQKLVDIDLDARRKAEDAKAKLREDEKKAEQDLLQKLKELRQRFLLDLEEALHARDARQVLRLIKEYKLEKQNILDRKKLDDEQRKDKLAEDLKAIEIERQRRIENENLDYRRRLEDLARAKAREQEELKLWYQREQEDIQRNVEQKLQKLLAGYIAEGKIHETEQAKIYAILQKYFGKDMALVDSLAQFMATRFAQISQLASMQFPVSAPYATYGQMPKTTTQKAKTDPLFQRHNFAEGGTLIADRPTVAMFGERGTEMAQFTPLNRTGKDVGKIFGNMSGGGINGQILVAVDLSPDLEGRIINRSLDGVADVVGRVTRRKQ